MTPSCRGLPASVLYWLNRIPADRGVAVLLRHSARDELQEGEVGNCLPISDFGRCLAIELGRHLQGRIRTLRTSPVRRCVETAEALAIGAGATLRIESDRLLGDPGVFVLDGNMAWSNWLEIGHNEVMRHLNTGSDALTGMARPKEAARYLVSSMLAYAGDQPGLHMFVTHDAILAPTAAQMLGIDFSVDDWPAYLEGAFFWASHDRLQAGYQRHKAFCIELPPGLSELDIVEFARREIANTVGLGSGLHFYLAGGAYKSLLTGKSPTDLDIWAATEQDRTGLIRTLKFRGANPGPAAPYSDSFELGGRVIEVPHKIASRTLDDLLAEFDIGLSAIGVEHHASGKWTPKIDPLALKSLSSIGKSAY